MFVLEVRCNDEEDKSKEERKKERTWKDPKSNGDGPSEDCARKIAPKKTTEDLLTSHLRDIGTIGMDDYVTVNEDDLIDEERSNYLRVSLCLSLP